MRTRTAGLLITSELLYHLSYIGLGLYILDFVLIFKSLSDERVNNSWFQAWDSRIGNADQKINRVYHLNSHSFSLDTAVH